MSWLLGIRCWVLVLVMMLMSGVVSAKDIHDPPWDPFAPNQTSQAWEFGLPVGVPPFIPGDPLDFVQIEPNVPFDNPYGVPYVVVNGPAQLEEVQEGPDGGPTVTLHIGETGQETGPLVPVDIWVPNFPEPNLYKEIFLQITADKSITPQGDPITTTPAGTNNPSPYPSIQHQGTWYTYNSHLTISPNPDGEWIHLMLAPCTNIEEIVIDTVCIPEPASLMLLGLGGMAMLRRRR